MKIEIEYDGSIARCKINGKPFNSCEKSDKMICLSSFHTIINSYFRDLKNNRR